MMIRHHHTNNNINSPFLMCSNICSDFFMQPFRPLSCVGGRWRVLLPVTGGAAAWLVSYQNRSLITVEQGRGQWLLPAPRTLLCYPSTFIFMYSVSVLPKTNPYSAGIISNSSSRTRSTKGRHMDREWRRRGEREGGVMLPEWINSGHVENTFQWQFCQCESSSRRQSANPADDQTRPSPGPCTVLVLSMCGFLCSDWDEEPGNESPQCIASDHVSREGLRKFPV